MPQTSFFAEITSTVLVATRQVIQEVCRGTLKKWHFPKTNKFNSVVSPKMVWPPQVSIVNFNLWCFGKTTIFKCGCACLCGILVQSLPSIDSTKTENHGSWISPANWGNIFWKHPGNAGKGGFQSLGMCAWFWENLMAQANVNTVVRAVSMFECSISDFLLQIGKKQSTWHFLRLSVCVSNTHGTRDYGNSLYPTIRVWGI